MTELLNAKSGCSGRPACASSYQNNSNGDRVNVTERPILFSAPMACASLNGSKTQTRRVVTGSDRWPQNTVRVVPLESRGTVLAVAENRSTYGPEIRNPYGKPGDRLWGRETFFAWGRWETRFSAKKKRDEWHFVDMTLECGHEYAYAADGHSFAPHQRSAGTTPCWWKRPAIFMPRAASRITLEIAGVRVERLQDISERDCICEGIGKTPHGFWSLYGQADVDGTYSPRSSFRALWESINGAGSWAANPWLWVVEFKRIEHEGATHGQTNG